MIVRPSSPKAKEMDFVFTGFADAAAYRQFAFDCVHDDRSRTTVMVRADMALARKYNILLQDLPLLCRRLLQDVPDSEIPAVLTFTEDRMIAIRTSVLEAASKRPHKTPKRTAATGKAWRNIAI